MLESPNHLVSRLSTTYITNHCGSASGQMSGTEQSPERNLHTNGQMTADEDANSTGEDSLGRNSAQGVDPKVGKTELTPCITPYTKMNSNGPET